MIDTEPGGQVCGPDVGAVEGDADGLVPEGTGSYGDRARWLRGIDHVEAAGNGVPVT